MVNVVGAEDVVKADAEATGAEGGQAAAGWQDTGEVVIKYPSPDYWSLPGAVPAAFAAIRKVVARGYQALA